MITKYEFIEDGSNMPPVIWVGNHLVLIKKDPFSRRWVKATYINVTKEQFDRWCCGEVIQLAMPNLSSSDREFMITGITPESWDKAFGNQ